MFHHRDRSSQTSKWKNKFKKVITPAGLITGVGIMSTVIAGGKDALSAGPQAVESFAN